MKDKRKYLVLLIIPILLLLFFLSNLNSDHDEIIEEEIETEKSLSIDIKGAVKNPGVYELKDGSVVKDAIDVSGGLLESANTEYINLSKKIVDEMVIIIYTNEEIQEMTEGSTSIKVVDKECICPKIENNECIDNNNKYANISNGTNQSTSNKISLNNASKEELMTLNGIGESKANAIIEYRNSNGLFKQIEDITNVKGIGNFVYEKIKDRLTL